MLHLNCSSSVKKILARFLLVCFSLSLLLSIASPVLKKSLGFRFVVCSTDSLQSLWVKSTDQKPTAESKEQKEPMKGHGLDCPLCFTANLAFVDASPMQHGFVFLFQAKIKTIASWFSSALHAQPPPIRAPPFSS